MYKLNDPVWVLGVVKGYFVNYIHRNDHGGTIRVGVPSNAGGVSAIVPAEWITERDING